jgi:hypothetical protein
MVDLIGVKEIMIDLETGEILLEKITITNKKTNTSITETLYDSNKTTQDEVKKHSLI